MKTMEQHIQTMVRKTRMEKKYIVKAADDIVKCITIKRLKNVELAKRTLRLVVSNDGVEELLYSLADRWKSMRNHRKYIVSMLLAGMDNAEFFAYMMNNYYDAEGYSEDNSESILQRQVG